MEDNVKAQLRKMIKHAQSVEYAVQGYGEVGQRVYRREADSLLRVIEFALRADRLWPDGTDGLGGSSGYVFGIVGHRQGQPDGEAGELLWQYLESCELSPVEWSVHS